MSKMTEVHTEAENWKRSCHIVDKKIGAMLANNASMVFFLGQNILTHFSEYIYFRVKCMHSDPNSL